MSTRDALDRVSCLVVTRRARHHHLERALADYQRQTHANRELIVVHDEDDEFQRAIARRVPQPSIVLRAASGKTLGALRNMALAAARGSLVCQWDDDDRHHPRRIESQLAALRQCEADFCFLAEQLHVFTAEQTLHWEDWGRDPSPFDFVPGTLLGRRDRMRPYPERARGEDSALILRLARAGCTITTLAGMGYLYVYQFHGANAWGLEHHAGQSAAKPLPLSRLLPRIRELKARLREFDPPLGPLRMPTALGALLLD